MFLNLLLNWDDSLQKGEEMMMNCILNLINNWGEDINEGLILSFADQLKLKAVF